MLDVCDMEIRLVGGDRKQKKNEYKTNKANIQQKETDH